VAGDCGGGFHVCPFLYHLAAGGGGIADAEADAGPLRFASEPPRHGCSQARSVGAANPRKHTFFSRRRVRCCCGNFQAADLPAMQLAHFTSSEPWRRFRPCGALFSGGATKQLAVPVQSVPEMETVVHGLMASLVIFAPKIRFQYRSSYSRVELYQSKC
jgi:hypothetical protein